MIFQRQYHLISMNTDALCLYWTLRSSKLRFVNRNASDTSGNMAEVLGEAHCEQKRLELDIKCLNARLEYREGAYRRVARNADTLTTGNTHMKAELDELRETLPQAILSSSTDLTSEVSTITYQSTRIVTETLTAVTYQFTRLHYLVVDAVGEVAAAAAASAVSITTSATKSLSSGDMVLLFDSSSLVPSLFHTPPLPKHSAVMYQPTRLHYHTMTCCHVPTHTSLLPRYSASRTNPHASTTETFCRYISTHTPPLPITYKPTRLHYGNVTRVFTARSQHFAPDRLRPYEFLPAENARLEKEVGKTNGTLGATMSSLPIRRCL